MSYEKVLSRHAIKTPLPLSPKCKSAWRLQKLLLLIRNIITFLLLQGTYMSYKHFVYALLAVSLYTHTIKSEPITNGAGFCGDETTQPMSPDYFPSSARATVASAYVHYQRNARETANSPSSGTIPTHVAALRNRATSPVVSAKS